MLAGAGAGLGVSFHSMQTKNTIKHTFFQKRIHDTAVLDAKCKILNNFLFFK